MTRKELIEFGQKVWDTLNPDAKVPFNTNSMAALVTTGEEGDLARTYEALKKLTAAGFPAAYRGPEQETRRYGKVYMMKPWLWRRAVNTVPFEDWAKMVEATPSSVGPYARIEERLAAVEDRLAVLEAAFKQEN